MQATTPTTPTTTSQPKPRIRHLAQSRYLVESFSRPGIGHQVDVLRLKCGCEAGSYGRRCKHLVLAIQYDAWRTREQTRAASTRKAERAATTKGTGPSAPVPQVPAPVPATAAFGVGRSAFGGAAGGQPMAVPVVRTPNADEQTPRVAGDWHTSAAYRGLAAAFGE